MDRMACVEVPALPLQLLGRRHSEHKGGPMVVVDHDRPQGTILWSSDAALKKGVRPGMRYASGLALAGDLIAGEVPGSEIAAGVVHLLGLLYRHSPHVEPLAPPVVAQGAKAGIFFLDASGLEPLFPSLRAWGREIVESLTAAGFVARVTVGFTRFGTWVASRGRSRRGVAVIATRKEEDGAARRVPLALAGLPPRARDTLERLGVATMGAFLDLPEEGVRRRFGVEAYRLHRLARAGDWAPVQSQPLGDPPRGKLLLSESESSVSGLLFLVKRVLHPLLAELACRHQGVAELSLSLSLDDGSTRQERLRPAAPTLDEVRIAGLLRLRLEATTLTSGVIEIELVLEGAAAPQEQIKLFAAQAARDRRAADEALARVRAELGNEAVVCAKLVEAHLPEARYRWEPLDHVAPPRRAAAARDRALGAPARTDVLVRRIQERAVALAPRPRHAPDGWLLRGVDHGSVEKFVGPYVVSGGWWVAAVHREYHYAVMRNGDIYWVYYDRPRRRWYLHGQVE